jgi:hypothetical protein
MWRRIHVCAFLSWWLNISESETPCRRNRTEDGERKQLYTIAEEEVDFFGKKGSDAFVKNGRIAFRQEYV